MSYAEKLKVTFPICYNPTDKRYSLNKYNFDRLMGNYQDMFNALVSVGLIFESETGNVHISSELLERIADESWQEIKELIKCH